MQYVYVLDYSTPSRVTIKVDDDIDVSEKIDDILRVNHLKASECSWMVSNKPLYDEVAAKLPKWKPKNNETYYRITWIGEVAEGIWYGLRNDESGYKFGNCFRTKKEAEAARDKIKEILNKHNNMAIQKIG